MRIAALILGLFLGCPAGAETFFSLTSTSEAASYAVLVMAPEAGCLASRVVLRGNGGSWRSKTLAAGEIGIVRVGRGFAVGNHRFVATTAGCAENATMGRRVVLGKRSPDHGWRGRALN